MNIPSIARQSADCIMVKSVTGTRLQRYTSVREARSRFVDMVHLLRHSVNATITLTDWDLRHKFASVDLSPLPRHLG